jgi:hypothetical protein
LTSTSGAHDGATPRARVALRGGLDDTERLVGELRINADRWQRDRLLRFAAPFEPRIWAIEAAAGLGSLLAQQLVVAGEAVVDVAPTLSARVRLLDAGLATRPTRMTPDRERADGRHRQL